MNKEKLWNKVASLKLRLEYADEGGESSGNLPIIINRPLEEKDLVVNH